MTRIKAASIHFAISISIFSIFVYFVYFIWYAFPFYILEGVGQIVLIMAGVDVVLGPMLTLALFKLGKPGLKMDLFLIALVQIFALVYGSYIIYSERPVYAVFHKGVFDVVDKRKIDEMKLPPSIKKVGFFDSPEFVYQKPLEGSAYTHLLKSLENKRSSRYSTYYENYLDYSKNQDAILKNTRLASNDKRLHFIPDIEQFHYTYIDGSIESVIVLLDKKTADIKQFLRQSDLP